MKPLSPALAGLALILGLFAFLLPTDTSPVQAASRLQSECWRWCNSNRDQCDQCLSRVGCGVGLRVVKRFRGRGKNWYACKRKGRAQSNLDACRAWCRQNPPCENCGSQPGCGYQRRTLKRFGGPGKNYYACAGSKRAGDWNRSRCLGWCNQNPSCARCLSVPGCGAGYKTLKAFRGKGKNWYACADRGGSESNYRRCSDYCSNHRNCAGCSRRRGCGEGQTVLKAFTGRGKNWYACRKRKYRSGTLTPSR